MKKSQILKIRYETKSKNQMSNMSKGVHKKDNNKHILLSKMRQNSVERKQTWCGLNTELYNRPAVNMKIINGVWR